MSQSRFYQYTNLNAIHEHGINLETREIYLHGDESDQNSVMEHRSATRFIKNLHFLEKQNANPIIVHLQSEGGNQDDGFALYDAIKTAQSYVTIICHGYCMSMGAIVLQAADSRVVMPNCTMLIHYGEVGIENTPSAFIALANQSKLNCDRFLKILAEKAGAGEFFSGYSLSKTKKYIDTKLRNKQDWYLTAEEAVNFGFADGIYGEGNFTRAKIVGV